MKKNKILSHTEKQMYLRTEQKPDYVKEISRRKDDLVEAIRSGNENNIDTVMKKILSMQAGFAISGDINITKLYLAAFFSELTEDTKKAGLPGNISAGIRDSAFQFLANAKTEDEISEISHKVYHSLFTEYRKYSDENYSENVKLAIERIHDMKMQDISPSFIASLIHVDRCYLSKQFHKETGSTMKSYIEKVKMDTAEKLILEKNYTLTEISSMLGYNNYARFSKIFYRAMGVLPGKYRK